MASFIPQNGPTRHNINTPLTLTALQTYVGGPIRFIELLSGDILVTKEGGSDLSLLNKSAEVFAGRAAPIYGDAVLCSPSEIA